MRRALPVLLTAVLLAGCSSDPDPEPQAQPDAPASGAASAAPSAAPSARPSAPAIEGLEVLSEDPSHQHTEDAVDYERVPPLGGPHHPRWLACDVYDEPVPLELAVHSLEHGAVWLAHAPDLAADQVERLAELAGENREFVLVAPQEGMDSPVVAVTWGAGLEATSADDPRLAQFVEAYAGGGQGGEPGAPCRTGGASLREARALTGSSA